MDRAVAFVNWFADRIIATKIFVVFGAVIAVGIAAAAINEVNLARLADADRWAEHTYKVLELSKDVLIAIDHRERSLSEMARDGRPVIIDLTHPDALAIDRTIEAIKAATADNISQQARIDRLKAEIQTWRVLPPGSAARAIRMEAVVVTLRAIDGEENKLLSVRTDRAQSAMNRSYLINLLGPIFASGIAFLLGSLLHGFIARPIADLTRVMRRLAEGDDEVVVPNTHRRDEIGAMSRALDVFKTGIGEADRLREDGRDMQRKGAVERAALMAAMADRFETVVGSVVQAVSTSATKMQGSAEQVLGLADRASAQVRDVAQSTREASSTMQVAAEEAEMLSANVGEISVRMEHSARVAEQAVEEADRTSATIAGLSGAAKRIETIVGLINAVARQTNLLALNATIESARAGDAGRGFAVVAAEVKTLADQTADATDDIRRQIDEIQIAASGSVAAIDQISRTIREMARITSEVNAAVDLQRDGTLATARSTKDTAGVTTRVSSRLETVSADALITGRAATDLLTAARDLALQSRTLREEAGSFVASVRAA